MKITIGISFYNSEATLAEAIRSVFAQSFQDWELILIDDGSQDSSLDIARAIDDQRVRVFSDGKNLGLATRLNQISELAHTDYIARMDADDVMHPTRLQRQLEVLESNPKLNIVSAGLIAIDSATRPVGIRGCRPMEVSAAGLLACRCIAHPTVMGRASWFRENRYDPNYRRAEDCELWCRAFRKKCLNAAVLAEPLIFYREEGEIRLSKILGSYRELRRIIHRDGPVLIGWRQSLAILASLHVKEFAYRLAALMGKEMMIVHRRNELMEESQQALAEEALRVVLETPVPGLAEARNAGELALWKTTASV
ncbi:MAG: glycosyltransferase [Planctomycetales bacterium]|nr:glycosyltransferase [Planctomycetales bacterium]